MLCLLDFHFDIFLPRNTKKIHEFVKFVSIVFSFPIFTKNQPSSTSPESDTLADNWSTGYSHKTVCVFFKALTISAWWQKHKKNMVGCIFVILLPYWLPQIQYLNSDDSWCFASQRFTMHPTEGAHLYTIHWTPWNKVQWQSHSLLLTK